MDKIKQLWNKVNGHKTNIGSFLVTVYTLATNAGLLEYNADVLTVLAIVFGVGVSHKAVKYIKETM